jgi:hypothetical protein
MNAKMKFREMYIAKSTFNNLLNNKESILYDDKGNLKPYEKIDNAYLIKDLEINVDKIVIG